jgi:uncharacterized protein (TIGR02246 family)
LNAPITGANAQIKGVSIMKDEVEIRELIAERVAAMKARDAERLLSRVAPDVVKFDLAPPLQRIGADARNADGLRRWFSGFDGAIDFEVRDLSVTAADDLAYTTSLNRLSATPHGSPQSFTLWFRATVCLRKIDGAWRIAHEHNSTPFYMDGSFRAALDLQP